jgi:hypothetical protein
VDSTVFHLWEEVLSIAPVIEFFEDEDESM